MANDVLLLGDSMTYRKRHPQGYGPSVRRILEPRWSVNLFREIFGYSSNARLLVEYDHRLVCANRAMDLTGESIEALEALDAFGADMSLEAVLTTPTPYKVVHFNSGLHDLQLHRRTGADGHPVAGWAPAVPLDVYVASLQKAVLLIKATGAKLLWSTTTPVDDASTSPYRFLADVVKYNQAALKVMQDHNVPVIDLFTEVSNRLSTYLSDGLHFTQLGCDKVGKIVARRICQVL